MAVNSGVTAPIADLSYRNYDGPLMPPRLRWWVIAKMTIRQALKKKSMWVAMAFSAWYYLAMIFVLFFVDQLAQSAAQRNPGGPNPMAAFFGRIVWKDQFLHGFSFGQIMFLIIALILGAGAIANDNRSNALLVYLSKPCTKWDYLFGKWVGVFLPLLITMLLPSMVFFLYGAMSYRDQGFFSQDGWVFLKLLAIMPIGAMFHASLVIGISSLFNQGRMAGATYAGLYFFTNFFTKAMTVAWIILTEDNKRPPEQALSAIKTLFYGSVDGLNIGMAKGILGTDGSAYFGIPSQLSMVPAPPLAPVLVIIFAVSALCMFVAWRRVRAVEVVG